MVSGFAAAPLAFAACTDNGSGPDTTIGTAREGGADRQSPGDDASGSDTDGSGDAGSDGPSICAITRAYLLACSKDLTCGPEKFDAWCVDNDRVLDSDTYRNAEAKCLVTANCDQGKRHDCDYRTYNNATPTTAQSALVAAYCATCEPGDKAGCATRSTTYDVQQGPDAVTDIFVAAWELADPVTDEIRVKCTGSALDAGTGDAACAAAFSDCSGGVYVDRLPNCP